MNYSDQELADKIVALLPDFHDWGDRPGQASGRYGTLNWPLPKIAHDFVRDWRVAGAMMEKCEAQCVDWDDLEPGHWRNMNHTSNTPRAINEACVEALS